MTKRQIARQLVDTEARIKLLTKQLSLAKQKADNLVRELERPAGAATEISIPLKAAS